jgi:hypothetical protein
LRETALVFRNELPGFLVRLDRFGELTWCRDGVKNEHSLVIVAAQVSAHDTGCERHAVLR